MSARPVIFIAYGERGASWLGRAGALSQMHPNLASLVAARVIQFWLVRDDGRTDGLTEHTTIVASGSSPENLRKLLEEGRSVRNRPRVGDLDLHTSLILERWSLFEPAAEARVGLRASLDAARRIHCAPDGDKEFEFEWISLADCVGDPARPDPTTIERARKVLNPDDVLRDFPLIIDRIDGAGAVIDSDLADQCFLEAALALADSSFGLPDRNVATTLPASLTSDPLRGHAIPLSVAVLHHTMIDMQKLSARRLEEALLSDVIDPGLVQGNSDELPSLLELETKELQQQTFSSQSARLRRRKSAIEFLQTAFVSRRDCGEFLGALRDIRRRLSLEGPPQALMPVLALSIYAASFEQQGEILPGINSVIFVVLLAALVLALGVFVWLRQRARNTLSPSAPLPRQRPPEVREQWETLCQRLEQLIDEWRDRSVSAHEKRADSTSESVWVRSPNAYCEWRLGQRWLAPRPIVEPRVFAELATECLQFTETGASAQASVDHAILELARRRDLNEQALGTVLRAALAQPHAEPVVEALRQLPPFMANAGAAIRIREVVWLVHRDLGITSQLKALEPASTRQFFQSMHHESRAATVRLVLGEPIPWREVMSLSFLNDE